MIKKIPCGGFFYDDETIEFDGKVISAKDGGGYDAVLKAKGSGVTIVSGSHAALTAKFQAGEPVNVCVVHESTGSGAGITTFNPFFVTQSVDGGNIDMKMPYWNNMAVANVLPTCIITWTAEDAITVRTT